MASGRTVQRQVLYLGEINDKQQASWQRTIDLFTEGEDRPQQVALFAEDSPEPRSEEEVVRIRLKELELHRPRQWGHAGSPASFGSNWIWMFSGNLVVTPEGFPLGYEVMSGNTRDSSTLKDFLKKIEDSYGAAERIWVMDRGIPTEETLGHMRSAEPKINYLVGTPKGRLSKMEKQFLDKPWARVRDRLEVKLLEQEGEVYVLAQSRARVQKERAMRRRRLKRLLARLAELRTMKTISRDELMLKLGAARQQAGRAWKLVEISLPEAGEPFASHQMDYRLNRRKLRQTLRREGRYLLRSNLAPTDPAQLWKLYTQLTEVEEAFKNIKGDLAIRPVHHQKEERIEAHIFIAFLAYCLHVTLRQRLRHHASGLTPRSVLEKMSTLQMLDVHLPTTDNRTILLSRYTQPSKDVQILVDQLGLQLPQQPPPKVYSPKQA